VGVTFYKHGLLTIDGVSSPVTDVSVSFDDDHKPAMPAPIVSSLTMSFESEVDAAALDALMAMMPKPTWPQWLRVEYAGRSALVPIFEHDTREMLEQRIAKAVRRTCPFTVRCTVKLRGPRWLRLQQRRRAKAKAKRAKMRAARYAARWEQAHLRGGKS
jgi:hypothetical protein